MDEQPETFGRAGTRLGVALAVLWTSVGIALMVLTRNVSVLTLYPFVFGVSVLLLVTGHRADAMVLEDEALVVEGRRRGRREYRWEDLLEVGWTGRAYQVLGAGPGPIVRPRGGAYDMPGPNSPMQVGTLAIFGGDNRERARAALQAACERHGVPYSDRGVEEAPPPGSWLRQG